MIKDESVVPNNFYYLGISFTIKIKNNYYYPKIQSLMGQDYVTLKYLGNFTISIPSNLKNMCKLNVINRCNYNDISTVNSIGAYI